MEPTTRSISLHDCVKWAFKRKGLKSYTFLELAQLYLAYPPQCCYCVTDPKTGAIKGTAIAIDLSVDTVRIPFISTDGSKAAMRGLVARLKRNHPAATRITFLRRGREQTFQISKLDKLYS